MSHTLLTNGQVVAAAGLPASIVTALQTEQGDTFAATANQFLTAIVNKIVYQKVEKMTFNNPFKKYDSFPVPFGDTIENIFVDMPIGYQYNKDATDPFAKKAPEVKALYSSINYEMQYQVTVQDKLIKRAVLKEYGLMELVDSIVNSLVTRKSIDEYLATVMMLNNADIYAGGFETFDTYEYATDAAKMQAVAKKMASVVHDFALPSKDNNKAGVMNVSNPSDILIIIKQSLLDKIDFDFLQGVFNLEKVNIGAQIIPVRDFKTGVNTIDSDGETVVATAENGEDLDFVILDTRGFDNHVALEDGGMIYNPKGKYTNHFANLWKIISYKYWHQARAYKINDTQPNSEP